MQPRTTLPASLAAALMLGACAQDITEYPSLAKRPAERVTTIYGTSPGPQAPVIRPAPDDSVLGRLDSLLAEAERADARFRKGESPARRLVATSGRSRLGSEGWSIATTAVSELEAARGQAMVSLTELDLLYAQATVNGEDTSAIANVRDQVIAIVARHDYVLGELRTRLGS